MVTHPPAFCGTESLLLQRRKSASGGSSIGPDFPSEAIRYCLGYAGIRLADVEIVAINSNPKASILKKISYAALQRPDLGLLWDRVRNQSKRRSIELGTLRCVPTATRSAAPFCASSTTWHISLRHSSSRRSRRLAWLRSMGSGDYSSGPLGVGQGKLYRDRRQGPLPHSLGVFYQALTQFIGFPFYGDEYKSRASRHTVPPSTSPRCGGS